jgi:uncharacterized membrane protein
MSARSGEMAFVAVAVLATMIAGDVGFGFVQLRQAWLSLIGAALVFLMPGYAILGVSASPVVDGLEKFVLAASLNLAVVILAGLALNAEGALTTAGWAVALSGLTAFGLLLSYRPLDRTRDSAAAAPLRLGHSGMFMLMAACAVAGLAVETARRGAVSHKQFAYTEFWLVRNGGTDSQQFTLGIANREQVDETYETEIHINGRLADRRAGIQLGDGQDIVTDVVLPFLDGRGGRIEAWLFKRADHKTVYRRVWATLAAPGGAVEATRQPANPANGRVESRIMPTLLQRAIAVESPASGQQSSSKR